MAATAVARAVAAICVIIHSFFNWTPEEFSRSSSIITFPLSLPNADFHIAGLILARGGSKGIPKKNIVNLNGQPLIGWALHAMLDSGAFQSVWVSTDSSDIEDWVTRAFPSIEIHRRAAYTATDEATSIVAVQEFLSYHPEFDAVGLVQATSPFIQPSLLQKALRLLDHCDSVFSVTRSHGLRWKAFKQDSSSENTSPLNFDPRRRPRRQDWDGEMVENGMFYFATRELLLHENVFQGPRACYVEVPSRDSLQIDTPEDLEMAEYFMSHRRITAPSISKQKPSLPCNSYKTVEL